MGDRIVLKLDPCPQAIALICACSNLGLVFIPLSPDTPDARLHHIIQTTDAKLLIQQDSQFISLNDTSIQIGILEGESLHIQGDGSNPRRGISQTILETDLAYIVFTSGTTGQPKGIMMTHKAVLNFYYGLVEHCRLEEDARIGTISPLQFDFSLLDMGLAFGSGSTLVQVPKILVHQPVRFIRYLIENEVTQMNGVPSIWRMVLKHSKEAMKDMQGILKGILYAGEAFAASDIVLLQELLPELRVINCFGQSESVACTFYDVPNPLSPNSEYISIGNGHDGVEMMLIDSQGNEIAKPGEVGEIYLRGSSLFSGYWRNEQATNQVLVPHPLRPFNGEKVFATGDLAFKGAEGEFYFKGRKDLQVKILGNRVEIEEVERVLASQPSVKDVVVVSIQRDDNQLLVSFIVSNEDTQDEQQIRANFLTQLPSYMLPSHIRYVPSLPLTINGKVDRDALSKQFEESFGGEFSFKA